MLGDAESYSVAIARMTTGPILLQIFVVALLGIGRIGTLSLRKFNWHKMSKEEVISDKISLRLQVAGTVLTLYILCGLFSWNSPS